MVVRPVRPFGILIGVLSAAGLCSIVAPPASAQRSPDSFIERMDTDGDGRISRREYRGRRRPFDFFDTDGNGFATRAEIERRFSERRGGSKGRGKGDDRVVRLDGQVSKYEIDRDTQCAISRSRKCDVEIAIKRGLFETGLRPRFPDGVDCRDIDEQWAISYSHKRDKVAYHGGIDMPAPFGTPIIAAAAGTVVAKSKGEETRRGIEVILRHSPADTGIGLWTYTQYAHFNEMPKVRLGERVRMGQVLGPTGNSGEMSMKRERRPAIHFAVWYSENPKFAIRRNRLLPVDGHWMDPNALYRGKPPYDSKSMKDLDAAAKRVTIPVMLEDGTTIPAETKLVWPYRCQR